MIYDKIIVRVVKVRSRLNKGRIQQRVYRDRDKMATPAAKPSRRDSWKAEWRNLGRGITNRSDSELRSQINAFGGPKEASSSSLPVRHDGGEAARGGLFARHRALASMGRRAHP